MLINQSVNELNYKKQQLLFSRMGQSTSVTYQLIFMQSAREDPPVFNQQSSLLEGASNWCTLDFVRIRFRQSYWNEYPEFNFN